MEQTIMAEGFFSYNKVLTDTEDPLQESNIDGSSC